MELSDLAVFQTVAMEGGITKAAAKLHRVPSNVTARVQKLEQELNKKLFIREKNRLRISPAGEHLLGYAERILALAKEATEGFEKKEPQGQLKLGSIEMAAATRIVKPLMVFHREYPQVDIVVTTAPTGILIQQVLSGELDMALVSDPSKDARLVIKPAYKEILVLVSDLNVDPIRTPKDLGPEPTLLAFTAQCAYRTHMTNWLKETDVMPKVIEVNSYHAMLSCVTAGMGVGIIPQGVVDIFPFKKGLKIHSLPAKWRHSSTGLIWRKDSVKPSMTAFSQVVLGECRHMKNT